MLINITQSIGGFIFCLKCCHKFGWMWVMLSPCSYWTKIHNAEEPQRTWFCGQSALYVPVKCHLLRLGYIRDCICHPSFDVFVFAISCVLRSSGFTRQMSPRYLQSGFRIVYSEICQTWRWWLKDMLVTFTWTNAYYSYKYISKQGFINHLFVSTPLIVVNNCNIIFIVRVIRSCVQ